jgi:hypothetical protein
MNKEHADLLFDLMAATKTLEATSEWKAYKKAIQNLADLEAEQRLRAPAPKPQPVV